MKKTALLGFLLILNLTPGSSNSAQSENSQPGQDEGNSFKVSVKDPKSNLPKDGDQFFIPLKPNDERDFLILHPDGKTPIGSENFLTSPDRIDKKPGP
jgi:hypothetical protein